MVAKKCISCNLERDESCFYKGRNACKCCVRTAVSKYRTRNPEKIKAWKKTECAKRVYVKNSREYTLRNPKNREKYNAYMREWKKKNKDKVMVLFYKWRENNPDRVRASRSLTKATRRGAQGKFRYEDIMGMLSAQNKCCNYCKSDISERYELDHIMPISLGGSNDPSNLQILCRSCNAKKGAMHPDKFLEKMRA